MTRPAYTPPGFHARVSRAALDLLGGAMFLGALGFLLNVGWVMG
jgi:hypothetical protein